MCYAILQTLFWLIILAICPVFENGFALAENIDPLYDDSQYAYGENIGWLNAEPSGNGGPGAEVANLKLTGYLWAENIGWVNLSCENTSSCSSVNFGVINDGLGNLSGYAWAENVGWLCFSCEDTDSCNFMDYGVMIDPITGEFSGTAWGENIGWISFSSTTPVSYGVTTSWVANYNPCECDFAHADGDTDGKDLSAYIADSAGISLDVFAADFGRTNCP
jgi:hypothetical protein